VKLVIKPLERVYFAVTDPIVTWLLKLRVRPNTLTTIGALVVVASGVAFAWGWIRTGGAVLLLSGIVDTFDGAGARRSGHVSKSGAFSDSTLDRVGDGATFMGIAVYLLTAPDITGRVEWTVVCMVAIVSALIVSYARARAEGLGIDCKVGIVQRAERLLAVGVPTLFVGAGSNAIVLKVIVAALALASTITVVQRFVYMYQVTEGQSGGDTPSAT